MIYNTLSKILIRSSRMLSDVSHSQQCSKKRAAKCLARANVIKIKDDTKETLADKPQCQEAKSGPVVYSALSDVSVRGYRPTTPSHSWLLMT